MPEYAPGTVAKAFFHNGGPLPGGDARVLRSNGGWHVVPLTPNHASCFISDGRPNVSLTDIRPLVVLDLDGEYGALELASWLDGTDAHLSIGDRIRIAREIRRQTKPPRIPEPGLWGVVEGKSAADQLCTRRFVRKYAGAQNGGYDWQSLNATDSPFGLRWDAILEPTLIRPGLDDDGA